MRFTTWKPFLVRGSICLSSCSICSRVADFRELLSSELSSSLSISSVLSVASLTTRLLSRAPSLNVHRQGCRFRRAVRARYGMQGPGECVTLSQRPASLADLVIKLGFNAKMTSSSFRPPLPSSCRYWYSDLLVSLFFHVVEAELADHLAGRHASGGCERCHEPAHPGDFLESRRLGIVPLFLDSMVSMRQTERTFDVDGAGLSSAPLYHIAW